MALSNSIFLIRDYENIRAILRDIYIYGCFSKDDFVEKLGISSRKYDKEQQRISAYLPENFIQKRRVEKKQFSIAPTMVWRIAGIILQILIGINHLLRLILCHSSLFSSYWKKQRK